MKKAQNQKFPPILSNPIEKKLFELSHVIWGQDNKENENPLKKENAAKKPPVVPEVLVFVVVDNEESANIDKMGFFLFFFY